MGATNSTSTITGNDMALLIYNGTNYVPVAVAKSYSLNTTSDLLEVATMSDPDGVSYKKKRTRWDISIEALTSLDETVLNLKKLQDLRDSGEAVGIALAPITNGAMNDAGADGTLTIESLHTSDAANGTDGVEFTEGASYRYGEGMIESVQESYNDGELATFSVSIKGNNQLTWATVAADA